MNRIAPAPALLLAAAALICGETQTLPVLVVVNLNSSESRRTAEYYARRRAIPPTQICSIRTITGESVDRSLYETQIEDPVRRCLDSKALSGRLIHYIVLTAGMPLRVNGSEGMQGTLASVDSELALLYLRRLGKPVRLEGTVTNPFFRHTYTLFDQRAFPIYLVARLASFDWSTTRRMIDDAISATNGGRFVLDMKESETSNSGDAWLSGTALQLPRDRVKLDSTEKVLTNETGVIGYAAWGSNDPHRTQRKLGFEWLSGSVATEYVSTNGRTLLRPPDSWIPGRDWKNPLMRFAGSPQSLAADYLAEGATAATAHTDEPYLGFTPRPDLMLPAYHNGRTLGESYYLSLAGLSWRNMLLGDPLCRIGPPAKPKGTNSK